MKRIWTRFAALLLMAMLLSACALAETATVGLEAPDFEVVDVNGETFQLSDYRGKVVFVNIWATWCPPCRAEMPDIEKLSQAHPDDLVVLGLSCDETEGDVTAFLAQSAYTYRFAHDAGHALTNTIFPTYAIPNSIFIDPDGIVTSIELGMADYQTMEARYLDAKAHAEAE